MKYEKILILFFCFAFYFLLEPSNVISLDKKSKQAKEKIILQGLHSISSNTLYEYVTELTSDKYEGRLTGTEGYQAAANWMAAQFKEAGIKPSGDNGTYFQYFDNPYTLVFPGCEVYLHVPQNDGVIKKYYRYEDEFIPGSTSGSGEVTAEVIYAGYGVSAPELNYDDYASVDVKGKIVLLEREAPVSPNRNPELFKKWRPYSFHQYKLENAVKHGAKGMLYNYGPIANPNNSYVENFIYSHVGDSVVEDIFTGTKKNHQEIVEKIKKELRPQSFVTGKTVTIKNITEHHPDGRGSNVIGIIEGNDPELKKEVIMVGAHLDHLGYCYEIMPGANDNASGVAVLLGAARALADTSISMKRSVMFIGFGAEEQAVAGSKYYLENPTVPLEKTLCLFNMDGVGLGDSLRALAAKNYPEIWTSIEKANNKYVHRYVNPTKFANLARPRLDAARFLWANVPTISYSAYGLQGFYHITKDDIETITPEIMEDLAQILFLSVVDIANQKSVNFRK